MFNRMIKFFKKNLIIGIAALLAVSVGFWYFYFFRARPDFSVELPAAYNEAIRLSSGGSVLSIRPREALAAAGAEAEGPSTADEGILKKVLYADAFAGADVIETLYEAKMKEEIILKDSRHADEFAFEINLDDFKYEIDEQGNIVIYQADGRPAAGLGRDGPEALDRVFVIPAAFMVDANGVKSNTSDVGMKIEGNVLRIIPNRGWLASHKYPVTIDPTVELAILNLYSHPQAGEDWTVEFTTQGSADLWIIPNDQATIDDDEFVSLFCGDKRMTPEIRDGDEIYFKNWSCDSVGKVVHNTIKAGNHTLRFEFGGQIAYAYNEFLGDNRYAWAENAGWLAASSTDAQVTVTKTGLTGYMWGENIGWLKLDYDGVAGATNTTATDWGVVNDGDGNLSGYAYGENIGWVNFYPTNSEVRINPDTGAFYGQAWAENIGWINFAHNQTSYVLEYTGPPFVKTKPAESIGSRVITARGAASKLGYDITERGFKYGLTETDTWSVSETGTFNSGDFTLAVQNLAPGTTYYIRAYAVNSEGTGYGDYVSFQTEADHTSTPVILKGDMIFKGDGVIK